MDDDGGEHFYAGGEDEADVQQEDQMFFPSRAV
jgi:hypothetical protein